nr:MAG: ORF1 [Torque teno midi virus]
MPFWWARRNKRWYGNRYRWRRRRRPKYKRKRRFNRRTNRRTYRRYGRRRRKYKVRKKKKKLHLVQWQPSTIRKCKIKGHIVHAAGAHGRQYRCYTDNQYRWTHARAPGGGGFGAEKYTLQFLYQQHIMGNNIWTFSNKNLDLCRYTGCKFRVYRHLTLDFFFQYSLMYPMQINKYSYSYIHPGKVIISKHKKLIPSLKSKPHGRKYRTIKIGVPKQLQNKWYFQESFADQGLVEINTVVCDTNYSYFGCCNSNNLISFKHLNMDFYKIAGWGNATTATQGYKPRSNAAKPTFVTVNGKKQSIVIQDATWNQSISYQTGWFQPLLLQATKLWATETAELQEVLPIVESRYNPLVDDGSGNKIYFLSILNTKFEPPKTDQDLLLEDIPLWQAMHGFSDWVTKTKKDKTYLATYYIVFQSRFVEPAHTISRLYIILDDQAIKGNSAFGEPPTQYQLGRWYPNFLLQQETVNNFVISGPYSPKLQNQNLSTWELKSSYCFYFKWGGADLPDQEVADPEQQATYNVPNNLSEAIQIANPALQSASRNLHCWDFRRGFITPKALKRIYQDSETSTNVSTDSEPTSKKKKISNSIPFQNQQEEEIHQSLLSLYKENTSQEQEEISTIKQLIDHQHKQQRHLKHNILRLINNLQKQQMMLQLQTGMLN